MSNEQYILPTKKKSSPLKTIAIVVIVGVFLLFLYKQFRHYQRTAHLTDVLILSNDSVDYNYHDKELLHTYIAEAAQYNKIAQKLWMERGINPKKKEGVKVSADLLQATSLLKSIQLKETKLKESTLLKSIGLGDDDIHIIQEKDITPGVLIEAKEKEKFSALLKGKNVGVGSRPEDIWIAQKLINYHEYNIPVDGIYNYITDSAVSDFQVRNGLFKSHKVDDFTLEKLSEDE